MFIGAINQDMRAVLAGLAPRWRGRPVYVGCSGNATVERILASCGLTELHGNDVSIYSCALGHYLAGEPFAVTLRDDKLAWLEPYLQPGLPTVATLLLATSMFEFYARGTPYHERMWGAYVRRFPALHHDTCERIQKATEGVMLKSFYAGDVVDFFRQSPQDAVLAAFPPTYSSGYERLYRRLEAAFDWNPPEYEIFTEERFAELVQIMRERETWVLSRDHEITAMAEYRIAMVQTGMRSKPVHMYSNERETVLTLPRQHLGNVPWGRLERFPEPPLRLEVLSGQQLNTIRSEYLSPEIAPATADLAFGLLAGGRLVGAFALSGGGPGQWCDLYMMTDLAVHCPAVPRLSKLVLAAALSTEVQVALEQKYCKRVRTIGTTAFTDKPVSMKYRGVCDLHSRKDDPPRLNYVGKAGRWTLQEGYDWWAKHHSKTAA